MLSRQNNLADLPGEVWADIKGYEGYYDVSNMGRVRSYWRRTNRKRYLQDTPYQILKGRKKKQSTLYLCVTLFSDYKRKYHYKISRLVAQAFLGLDYGDKNTQVIFIDGDGTNNRLENLKLGTVKDRATNAIGLGSKLFGYDWNKVIFKN